MTQANSVSFDSGKELASESLPSAQDDNVEAQDDNVELVPWREGWGGHLRALRELIPRLELATVHLRLIPIDARIAIGPAQIQIGSKGKRDRVAVNLSLNTDSFRRSGHGKVQRLPEDHGMGCPHHVRHHGPENLGLQQERGRIRPVPRRHCHFASAL